MRDQDDDGIDDGVTRQLGTGAVVVADPFRGQAERRLMRRLAVDGQKRLPRGERQARSHAGHPELP